MASIQKQLDCNLQASHLDGREGENARGSQQVSGVQRWLSGATAELVAGHEANLKAA